MNASPEKTPFWDHDPDLKPYGTVFQRRLNLIQRREHVLTHGKIPLTDFAAGHEYFGLHFRDGEWVFREWAPNVTELALIGQMTNWQKDGAFALHRLNEEGVWEIRLPAHRLHHQDLYRLRMTWPGGFGDRIPAYVRRVVQDPETKIFNAQVWHPDTLFSWQNDAFRPPSRSLLIYEAHVGMAQEAERVGTYAEFRDHVLPRIVKAGYNTVQLMALQEHPYYGSFGYQISSFFAASSRFGTPEDLKSLVDRAHGMGLRVIMDLIHSHAVNNEVEGLSRFDGTTYQYFHEGPRGRHPAWDSRCFNYARHEVLHFLLSNCRFWLDEYHLDGFRFDGITSMLYHHHGLSRAFTSYSDYFDGAVDEDALAYLGLANRLIHAVRPDAVTIAEDVSGMPGLAAPADQGGVGFDCRFAMGVPDYWIRLTKDTRDEDWPMGHLWFELTNRRKDERTISYAESHDQALVGDQTLIFRLIGADMYDHMAASDSCLTVDRGMALHKMIRLITLGTADSGYLTFMGNEFGHPEWIDFPREGNQWSYRYARRQWGLLDHTGLKYHFLARFDRDMVNLARAYDFLGRFEPKLLYEHGLDKIISFVRGDLLFVFNFHPSFSYRDYCFPVRPGSYALSLDSDASAYGGHGRLLPDEVHHSLLDEPGSNAIGYHLSLYLPNRTGLVLKRMG